MFNLMGDERCVSLVELQERHEALVESVSDETAIASREKITQFIELCVSLGYVLDASADRSVAQSLISYWVNRQARRARRATRLADEATDVSVQDSDTDSVFEHEDDSGESLTGSQKTGRNGSNNHLLAEFDQEAFNQYVVNPAEQWVRSLPEDHQSLVGHIVLRLMTLKNDGEFEAVPGTQLVLEGLSESELAKSLLEELVRLGVVRRQRRSLDLEEYSLQSLVRLQKWTSLTQWMQERKRFRNSAKEVLEQLQQADLRKVRPIVYLVRLVRGYMIRIGDACIFYFSKYIGKQLGVHTKPQVISDQVMQQAEYYHDKNAEELKVLYLKRQLDRVTSEINKERFVGISVALGMVLALLVVSVVQWRRADRARKFESAARSQAEQEKKAATDAKELTEKTAKTCKLLIAQANAALEMNAMVQDPAGAWLRGLHSLSEIAANDSVFEDRRLSEKWLESNLWSLGSAGLQTPVLTDLLIREPAPTKSPSPTSSRQTAPVPAQATVLSENGQSCMMVDATPEQISVKLSWLGDDGKWNTKPLRVAQGLELRNKRVLEHSVSPFISLHGTRIAFVYSVTWVTAGEGQANGADKQTQSLLFAGSFPQHDQTSQLSTVDKESSDKEASVSFIEKIESVGTACFDADAKYFALASSTDSVHDNAKLSVWLTANWEKRVDQSSLPAKGRVQTLAFSNESQAELGTSRGATNHIQLAAAVASLDGFTIQRLELPAAQVSAKNQSSAQWQEVLSTTVFNPDSSIILRYSPQEAVLFCSHHGEHYLLGPRADAPASPGLRLPFFGGTAQCRACAFNADGSLLALGLRDGKVSLWNIETLYELLKKPSEQRTFVAPETEVLLPGHPQHGEEVFGIRFSPDGKYLVSCGRDKRVQVYDICNNQPAAPPIVHNATVNAANVSLDGRFLTTLTRDIAYSWEFPTTRWLNDSWYIPTGRTIQTLAKSSNDCLVVGGKRGDKFLSRGWIRVCPTLRPEDRPLDEIDLPHPVQQLAISEDGFWVGAVDVQGGFSLFYKTKRVWEQANSDMNVRLIAFDTNANQPRFLLCGESNRTSVLRICKPIVSEDDQIVVNKTSSFEIPVQESGLATVAAFDPWQIGCVVGTESGRLYYCKEQEQIVRLTIQNAAPHQERITQIAFHRETRLIASGSDDDRVTCWASANDHWESEGYQLDKLNGANITSLAVSPSGDKLAAASADGRAVIWQRQKESKTFKHFFTIVAGDTGSSFANAMAQVAFVEGISDERYIFCRRNDRTVRVYDTLQINDPLNPEQLLLDGREVASFSIPHQVLDAQLKLDGERKWIFSAIGFDNTQVSNLERESSQPDEPSSWNAKVGLSERIVRPFPENVLTESKGQEIQDLASLVSGRQMRGQLRPLTALQPQNLYTMWNSTQNVRSKWPSKSPLAEDNWHLREAMNALTEDARRSSASNWHFERMSKRSPRAQLQFAASLGPLESMRALEELGKAEKDLGNTLDFLSLRASIRIHHFRVSKSPAMLGGAIEDYRKILSGNPQDMVAHNHLAEALNLGISTERTHTKEQIDKQVDELLVELDAIINSAGVGPPPNIVKMRGAIHSKYTKNIDSAIDDMIRAGDLYWDWQQFDEAYGEFMGAISLVESNALHEEKKVQYATAYRKQGDYYSWRESSANRVGKQALDSYYTACDIDGTNVQNLQAFIDSYSRAEGESSLAHSWTEVDQLFKKAIELEKNNSDFYRQRIAALLRTHSQGAEVDERLELVLQVFKAMESGPGLSTEDYIHFAGVYVHLDRFEEAEQLLTIAWEKTTGDSILAARLGVVLALRNKQEELKVLVDAMAKRATTVGDKNNVAWTANFVDLSQAELKPLVALAESAVAEYGNNANYLNTLGAIYVRAGENSDAIAELKKATQQRNALPDYLAPSNEKLFGNALDLLLSAAAHRALEDFESADEQFEMAQQQFNRYLDSQTLSKLCDSEWNVREYNLLIKQAQP